MKWINVKNKYPNHHDIVLIRTSLGGFGVVIYWDGFRLKDDAIKLGMAADKFKGDIPQHIFASKEVAGNHVADVTHWCYIDGPHVPQTKNSH